MSGFVVGLLLALFLTCDFVYEYLSHLREVIMPFPDISNRPYQLSMLPSANHTLLNYLTLSFIVLQLSGLVLYFRDAGLPDSELVNIKEACEGRKMENALTSAQ